MGRTGKQVVDVLIKVVKLNAGKGFLTMTSEEEIAKAKGRFSLTPAHEEIGRRMEPVNEALEVLRDLCKASGLLWKHPTRGWAAQTWQKLTSNEETALDKLLAEISKLQTRIIITNGKIQG